MLNMKRIVCALFCQCFLALVCVPSLQAQTGDPADGVTVKDDKVYRMHGGQLEVLADSLKLPFDVEVDANGNFKVANGKERKLEAGQVIRSDGWLSKPDGSVQPVFDHVAMKAGRVIVVRDGQGAPLTESMTFSNNLRVTPDGSCVYPDGSRSRLADGQLFRLDGTSIPAKDAVTLINGQVVVQKDGTLIPLKPVQIIGMNDGTTVRGDGFIQKRAGAPTPLREGQTVLIEGLIIRR
jgi:hypothetical protein